MIKKFEIDENLIAMAAFTKIVKKYYKDMGANRSPEVIEKFKMAMLSPEHFCRLDFDADDIQRRYANLKITVGEFDPNVADADIIGGDVLDAYNELEDIDKKDTPAVNAGRFLEMLDDKTFKYYKIGNFAPEHDDSYFMGVLEEKLKHYKPYKADNTNNANNVNPVGDVIQITEDRLAEKVKDKILGSIIEELPRAFSQAIYTNK